MRFCHIFVVKNKFCNSRGLPSVKDIDFIEDFQEDEVNYRYYFSDFRPLFPEHSSNVLCYFKYCLRKKETIQGKRYRRNVLNAIFYLNKLNLKFFVHQTFRYPPKSTSIKQCVRSLLSQYASIGGKGPSKQGGVG